MSEVLGYCQVCGRPIRTHLSPVEGGTNYIVPMPTVEEKESCEIINELETENQRLRDEIDKIRVFVDKARKQMDYESHNWRRSTIPTDTKEIVNRILLSYEVPTRMLSMALKQIEDIDEEFQP